ncbi:MAG: cyclic nucleotide-binding domain-containing protein [Myxococcota bacterium]|nr:cyclic nucleotide-binding domain-containing protein [Myxococcota bacterium]
MGWKYIDTRILKDVEIFSQLNERGRQEIIVLMTTVDVKQGQPIFEEGDPGDALYVILSGEVRISKNIPGVGEEALAFLPTGSCFGEMALIENRIARSASAYAQKDCELAKLARDDFMELLDKEKDLAIDILWGFVRVLSNRLRNSNDKVAFLAMSNMFE